MASDFITAVVSASSAVVVAGLSYLFTKKREREAELRKEKLEHYKAFISSMTGNISGQSTGEGQRAFSQACNNLNLIAPQSVINALQEFQQEILITNKNRSEERHDKLLSRLLYEMRKDLQVTPSDDLTTFRVRLWVSGVSPEKKKT